LLPAKIFISAQPGGRFDALGWPVVPDNFPGQGPLAGIESALGIMPTPWLLALAVDLPRMREQTLIQITAHCENCGAVPCFDGDAEPLAAVYPKAAHSIATALLRGRQNSVTLFAHRCASLGLVAFHELPAEWRDDFANWNSPADIEIGGSHRRA
jgi:molybdopterin-guanine dinucleotide biosynthesis protein A